jgi:hypothetical protein
LSHSTRRDAEAKGAERVVEQNRMIKNLRALKPQT